MTKNLIDKFWQETNNKKELFEQYCPDKNFADIDFKDIKKIYYKVRFVEFEANFSQQISKFNPNTANGRAKITQIIVEKLKASNETKDKEKKLSLKEIDYLTFYYQTIC